VLEEAGRGIEYVSSLCDVAPAIVPAKHMAYELAMHEVVCIKEHHIGTILIDAIAQPRADEAPFSDLVSPPAHEIGFNWKWSCKEFYIAALDIPQIGKVVTGNGDPILRAGHSTD
jgi:hypothetical protein